MLKLATIYSLLLLFVTSAWCREQATFQNNSAHEKLLFYKKEEAKGNATIDLYNNIGATYCRLNKPAFAILYFEKGLALSPLNLRLLVNRKKALNLCNADVVANNSNFYESQMVWIMVIENLNIVLTIILLGSLICCLIRFESQYRVVIRKRLKSIALIAVILMLLVYGINKKQQSQQYGIVIQETASKCGPSEKARSTHQWHAGFQVKIINTYEDWLKVASYNRESGWILRKDLLFLPE